MRLRTIAPHAAVLAVFLGIAVYVMHSLLFHPGGLIVAQNARDQANFEGMLTAVARQFVHGHNPLFDPGMNAPYGVNLMANPSMPAIGLAALPLTLSVGPGPTLALILTLNLAATAAAWYWFFLRHPAAEDAEAAGDAEAATRKGDDSDAASQTPDHTAAERGATAAAWADPVFRRRAAAALGGLICGFSPAMIAHCWGHPNLTAQWLFPLIVDRVLRLGRGGSGRRPLVSAAVLGALVAVQIGIAEEPLFIAVLTLGLAGVFRLVQSPRTVLPPLRPLAVDVAVAGGTAVVLAGYPLWFQFRGPGSYSGIPWGQDAFTAVTQSYSSFAPTSVFGNPAQTTVLAPDISETSAFIGIPLLLIAVAAVVIGIRRPQVRALTITGALLALLSLGDSIHVQPDDLYQVLDLWPLLRHLPFFPDVLPVRLSLPLFPILAYLVVCALREPVLDRAGRWAPAFGATLACALVQAPFPVGAQPRPPVPAFITAGLWKQCDNPGQAMLIYPRTAAAMFWSTAADQEFRVVDGLFFGPDSAGQVELDTPRPTTAILDTVDQTGTVPAVTPAMRAQAQTDARHWGIGCIALDAAPGNPGSLDIGSAGAAHPDQDRQLLTALYGPAVRLGSVWTWPLNGHDAH